MITWLSRRINTVKLTRFDSILTSLTLLSWRCKEVNSVKLEIGFKLVILLCLNSNRWRFVQCSNPVKSAIFTLSDSFSLLTFNSANFTKSSLFSSSVGIPNASRIAFSRLASLNNTTSSGISYSTLIPLASKAGMWVDKVVLESGLSLRFILPEMPVFSTKAVMSVTLLSSNLNSIN